MCQTHYKVNNVNLNPTKVLRMADIDVPDSLQTEQFDLESCECIRDGGHRCAGRTTK